MTKKFTLALLLLLAAGLSGCAYNSITITAAAGSTVTCTGTVDKPTSVDALPISGNTVPFSALPGLP